MEELTKQLELKQQELNDLQVAFDEFVESSRELETELEGSLQEMEEKRRDALKQLKSLEVKVADLTNKNENLVTENEKSQTTITKLKAKLDTAVANSKKLEQTNSSLEDRVRELEFTESELTAKLELAEEEKIVLQYSVENSPQKQSNETKRLKAELTELQAELARVDSELLEFKAREKEILTKEKEIVKSQQNLTRQQQTDEALQIHAHLNNVEAKLRQVTQEKVELQNQLKNVMNGTSTTPDQNGKSKKVSRANSTPVSKKGKDFDDDNNFREQDNEVSSTIINELKAKLSESEETIKELNQALEETQEELMTKCQENADYLHEISELRESFRDQEATMSKISSENEELVKHIEDLSNQLKNSQTNDIDSYGSGGQVTAIHAQLTNLTQEYKNASKDWSIEKSALLREKEKLQREIISLRKHRLSDTVDDMDINGEDDNNVNQSLNESGIIFKLIDSTGRARLAAEQAISSNDINRMKAELRHQLTRFEHMRTNNAILLNKLQSAKGNIQVCCRTRPPNDQELGQGAKVCVDVIDETELSCYDKRTHTWRSFNFDRVWDEDSTQADVFADIEPLALSVVDGYNACIIAYGQTGSGKTFTMNGYGTDYGVSYRTLHKIFELLNLKKSQAEHHAARLSVHRSRTKHGRPMSGYVETETSDTDGGVAGSTLDSLSSGELSDGSEIEHKSNGIKKHKNRKIDRDDDFDGNNSSSFDYSVEVAMLEIYNETVKDLLIPPNSSSTLSLDIRHDSEGRVSVPDLTKEKVTCLEDVMEVFARGSANRATTSTNLNEHSSRSHSILIVHVTTSSDNGVPITGKLYLVDLAGSERMDKSGVTGQAMKETQHINKSLSSLGDVMEGLDKKSKHIPYRNSKLTYLLQDSLGGNSKTMMIVTVCPTELTADETFFALQFATRARNIQLGQARKNMSWKTLEESLKSVKLELKEEKRRAQHLSEVINDMKRETKKNQEKLSTQMDTKLRNIDETRKGAELQIEVMSRTNADLVSRLQEEKEARRVITAEADNTTKALRKAQENIKMLTRDKEKTLSTLQTRDKEIENLRQLLRNIPGTGMSKQKSTPKSPQTTASEKLNDEKPKVSTRTSIVPNNPAVKTSKFLAPTSSTNSSTSTTLSKSNLKSVTSKIDSFRPGTTRGRTQSESNRKSSSELSLNNENNLKRGSNDKVLESRLSRSSSAGRIRDDLDEFPSSPIRQRSNSDEFVVEKRESNRRDSGKSPRQSIDKSLQRSSLSSKQSQYPQDDDNDLNNSSSSAAILTGSYRKGTVNAMATSRAQDAMIRHQERMKKKREMDALKEGSKQSSDSEWK